MRGRHHLRAEHGGGLAGRFPPRWWAAPPPPEFLPVMSDLYQSLSETWTGECLWNAPNLSTATQAIARLINQ